MLEYLTCEVSPQIIISSDTATTQDGNLTDSRANILTSGTNGRRFSKYYAGINEVFDMTDSVNSNAVSLCSAGFTFLMNSNGLVEDKYIVIVSKILEFPVKVIFSANQVHAASHFYDEKQRKLGGKQRLVTMDSRESRIFISDGIDYLPVSFPTDEYMESLLKVLLKPPG